MMPCFRRASLLSRDQEVRLIFDGTRAHNSVSSFGLIDIVSEREGVNNAGMNSSVKHPPIRCWLR
jgi:hypothetical protein